MSLTRIQTALNEFFEATRFVNSLVETDSPKKLRAPNVASALSWGIRKRNRDRLRNDPFDIVGRDAPPFTEPYPDPYSIRQATRRESPGPGKAVLAYRAKQEAQRVKEAEAVRAASRQARIERREASRERRLRDNGLPMSYTQAPKKSGGTA